MVYRQARSSHQKSNALMVHKNEKLESKVRRLATMYLRAR